MEETLQKPKPETEQKLLDLQGEYLKDRSVQSYQDLFSILHSYARSLILKKTKGKIFLPKDLVEDATLEACVRFMQQYDRPDFKIDTSFAGLLNLKILESLYGPKIQRNDKIASLSSHIEVAHKKEVEIGEMPETFKFTYLFRPDLYKESTDPMAVTHYSHDSIIKSVMSVFNTIFTDEVMLDYILINMAIILFLRKSKKYDKYRGYYLNQNLRNKVDMYLDMVKQRLVEYS